MALWGIETNFGKHVGKMDIISSLATLSYDKRRRDFFSSQLLILLKLIDRLWKRHGREDVALAAILLSNLYHKGMGTDPWKILQKSIHPMESIDSLLLNIEELFRAKRHPPNEEEILGWTEGRKIEQHLSMLVIYSATIHGHKFSSRLINTIKRIDIPKGDSILTRIKDKLVSLEAQY